jgi:HEPN domain-containing protein
MQSLVEAPNPSLMRRLTLVRFLYENGVEQSRRARGISALAILAFHDAVELFLQAALEHKGGTLKGKEFADYWSSMERVDVHLGRLDSMKRLNRARVSLKHHGTLPDHSHVEEFRDIVGAFLEESIPLAFGIKLAEISLIGLVKADAVRNMLRLAEESLRSGDYSKSTECAALAFNFSLREYANDGNLIQPGAESPYYWWLSGNSELDHNLTVAFSYITHKISEQITVLAYRLDFEGYRYLQSFGPRIYLFGDGDVRTEWASGQETITNEIASRCLAFAVDAALRLEGR